MSSENENIEEKNQIDYNSISMNNLHQNISDYIREKESNTFKFIATLLGGFSLPISSFFLEKSINISFDFNTLLFILTIISMFIFWWGAYFILTSSYQYRNLQRGLTHIQKKLKIIETLPIEWDFYYEIKKKNVLTEFYKPHYRAFIYGIILLVLIYIFYTLNLLNGSGKIYENKVLYNCCTQDSYLCFKFLSIINLLSITLLFLYRIRMSYNNKLRYFLTNNKYLKNN